MNKYYITGVSGTGKSALVKEFKKRGVQTIDLDATELCYWKNKTSGKEAQYQQGIGRDWLEAHDYQCDIVGLKKLLNSTGDDCVVIAGVTSNQDDYLDLFDKVFLLHCREETFLHRLNSRNENEFAKEKSEQVHILNWYKDFERKTRKRGALSINTEIPIKAVADQIISQITTTGVIIRLNKNKLLWVTWKQV